MQKGCQNQGRIVLIQFIFWQEIFFYKQFTYYLKTILKGCFDGYCIKLSRNVSVSHNKSFSFSPCFPVVEGLSAPRRTFKIAFRVWKISTVQFYCWVCESFLLLSNWSVICWIQAFNWSKHVKPTFTFPKYQVLKHLGKLFAYFGTSWTTTCRFSKPVKKYIKV